MDPKQSLRDDEFSAAISHVFRFFSADVCLRKRTINHSKLKRVKIRWKEGTFVLICIMMMMERNMISRNLFCWRFHAPKESSNSATIISKMHFPLLLPCAIFGKRIPYQLQTICTLHFQSKMLHISDLVVGEKNGNNLFAYLIVWYLRLFG